MDHDPALSVCSPAGLSVARRRSVEVRVVVLAMSNTHGGAVKRQFMMLLSGVYEQRDTLTKQTIVVSCAPL